MARETLAAPPAAVARKKSQPTKDFATSIGINQFDRVHIFIDALNLMGMLRSMEKRIDYKRLLAFLTQETRFVRGHYFALIREDVTDEAYRKSEGVIDFIEYEGFTVERKYTREVQEHGGFYRMRGTIVPEMTVAMINAAENGCDHMIVVTGDGELLAGIEAAKARGCRVSLLSQEESTANDLRRAADSFFDLAYLPEDLFLKTK